GDGRRCVRSAARRARRPSAPRAPHAHPHAAPRGARELGRARLSPRATAGYRSRVSTGRRGGTGRVTISDIAERAGVSIGAVSFALNGRKGVSDETRARILRVADELGWAPSTAARSLA